MSTTSSMKANTKRRRRIENWPLCKLQPHPSQAAVFNDLDDEAIKALAADMEANGLIHAVEVLPDGTIVCGHQRVRAAKLLGWEEIRCWIREDLEKKGKHAVEVRLIEDNLNRRQLGPLAKARAYRRLKELKPGSRGDGDLRDRLGKQLGCSGRTLDRLERLLDTPMEVQEAFDRRQISMAQASWIATLPKRDQQRFADKMRINGDFKDIVKDFAEANRKPAVQREDVQHEDVLWEFVHDLRQQLPDVQRHIQGMVPRERKQLQPWLVSLQSLLKEVPVVRNSSMQQAKGHDQGFTGSTTS